MPNIAHKLLNKIKEGRVVIPLSQLSVLKAIRMKISPLLATSSDAFIPPALKLDPITTMSSASFLSSVAGIMASNAPVVQTTPLSAAAVMRVEEVIADLFIRIGTNNIMINSLIIVN